MNETRPARQKKRRWPRIIAWIILTPILILLLALVSLHIWIRYNITPETLALHLEAEKNLRAQINSIHVDLLQHPAIVEIRGLKLARSDAEVASSIPFANRTPLTAGQTIMSIDSGVVKISLPSLIRRQWDLRNMVATNLRIQGKIDHAGHNNVEQLFDDRNPTKTPGQPSPDKKKPKTNDSVFTSIALGGVKGGNIEFLLERENILIRFEPDRVLIDGSVDTHHLTQTNTLKMAFEGTLTIVDQKRNENFATLKLSGQGTVHPYDILTQKIDPAIDFTLRIKKDSLVASLSLTELLESKPKERHHLQDLGLKTDKIITGGTLRNDTIVRIGQDHQRIFLRRPFFMMFDNFGLGLEQNDFVDLKDKFIKIRPRFLADEAMSNSLEKMVTERLAEQTNDNIAALLPILLRPLRDNQNRINISLKIRGDTKSPDVSLNSAVGEIGGSLASLVKGLFDNDNKKENKKKHKSKTHTPAIPTRPNAPPSQRP